MDPKFKEWLIEKGENPDTIDENRLAELRAVYEAGLDTRPYPNEDSCRLVEPSELSDKCNRVNGGTGKGEDPNRKHDGKYYDVIYCRDKAGKKMVEQAYRYKRANGWTAATSRSHCQSHGGKFEAATGEKKEREEIPQLFERGELTLRTYQSIPETLDEEGRSVESVIATETPCLVIDGSRMEVIEEVLLMSGFRAPKNGQVPLLDTHDRTTIQKMMGSTRNLRVENDKLIGRDFYSKSTKVEHAWTLTKEGHITDKSAGYKVIKSLIIPKGERGDVAGRQFTASPTRNLRITTEWMLGETSLCPIGADKDAKIRSLNINFNKGDKTMDPKFKEWLIARGENPDALDENKRTELEAKWKAEQKRGSQNEPKKKPDDKDKQPADSTDDITRQDPQKIAQDAVRIERERVNTVRALGGDDVPAEVIERCITEGKTIDQARTEVLTAIRQGRKNVSPNIQVGYSFNRQTLADALMIRSGYEDDLKSEKKGEERFEAARRFRSMRLLDMCRQSLAVEGKDIPIEVEDTIRAAFTTASLPVALGEYINKTLLKGYQSPVDTWSLWCSIGNASDFKTMTRVRVTDLGDWEEIGAAGEMKHGSFGEEYEQYKIATFGKLLIIDRQTIINDDLNTLSKASFFAGRRSRLLIAKLVYTHLLANGNMQDGIALFYATTHLNLNTSNGLTSGHLGTAKAALRMQKDKDGQPIDLQPAVLLVPPELEQTALELLTASTVVITGTTDLVKPNVNVHADGKLKLGVESRFSNAAYTGYSATTWFLMASPADADNIEVSFLNGKQTPTVQQVTLAPGQLGMGWQMFIDVGCKALDWRGMQKNTA